jgi:hypothetical protein
MQAFVQTVVESQADFIQALALAGQGVTQSE